MRPSMDEIQNAVNSTAVAVVGAAKRVVSWGADRGSVGMAELGSLPNFFNELASEKEVVKLILLLSGALHGARHEVKEYLHSFEKFSFLWEKNLQQEYKYFVARQPTLEDFDDELQKYLDLELELQHRVADEHVIGVISLHTHQIKSSLANYCSMWKHQYTENLLEMARDELQTLDDYMASTSRK